jgi:RND superfamily putative drug exporter
MKRAVRTPAEAATERRTRSGDGWTAWSRLVALPVGRRAKWAILLAWLALMVAVVPLAGRASSVENNEARTWLPADAESTRAFDIGGSQFGGADVTPALVVYVREAGLTAADVEKVGRDRRALGKYAHGRLGPATPDRDGRALLLEVPLRTAANDNRLLADEVGAVRRVVHEGRPAGLEVSVTGPAGFGADLSNAFTGAGSALLVATIGVVAILLLLIYRSPILWLAPLVAVGVSSQLANAAVYLLARNAGLVVNGLSLAVLTVLVFGIATDYALLLLARYREELRRHEDRHSAMAEALRRSLPAILASAVTIAASLCCLLAAEMSSTRGLGPVAAIGVVAALLAMTTLLPVLLVVLGRWVFWPFVPRFEAARVDAATPDEHPFWNRIARTISRRPRLVWAAAAVSLGAAGLGISTLSSGLGQQDLLLSRTDSVAGQELLASHFAAGTSSPVDVYARAGSADRVAAAVGAIQGVTYVGPVERSGGWAHFPVVPSAAAGSPTADRTVERLRQVAHAVPGASALVGGQAAIGLDTTNAVAHDEEVVIPTVLAVVLVVLVVLLRSLTAPLLLLGSVALSFLGAFGLSALVFHALGQPRIDQQTLPLPLFGFLFLMALGIDYTIFLMTRASEESARVGHARGILNALTVTGGVITGAGVVLAATFSLLAVLPLVTLLQLGVLVSVGVLLDTLVVRTLLVPALALDTGRRFWWPRAVAP